MARWTKKLIRQQLDWSNECFKRALIDVYGHRMSDDEKELSAVEMKRIIIIDWRQKVNTPEISAKYLDYLCSLESEKLSLILEAFKKGKQNRSQVTIEAIMTELFERSANTEKL